MKIYQNYNTHNDKIYDSRIDGYDSRIDKLQ